MHIFFSILLTLSFIVGSTHLSYAQDVTVKKTKSKKSKSVSADSSETSESFFEQLKNGESSNYGKIAAGTLVTFVATWACSTEYAKACKTVASKTYDFVSNHVSAEQINTMKDGVQKIINGTVNIFSEITTSLKKMTDSFSSDKRKFQELDASLADLFEQNRKYLVSHLVRIEENTTQILNMTSQMNSKLDNIQSNQASGYDVAMESFSKLARYEKEEERLKEIDYIITKLKEFKHLTPINLQKYIMSNLILAYCHHKKELFNLETDYLMSIVAYPRESMLQNAQIKAIEKSIKSDKDRLEYEPSEMQTEITSEIKKKEVMVDRLNKVNQLNINQEGFLVLLQDAIYEMLKSKFEKQPKELDKLERMRNNSLLNQVETAETFDVSNMIKELSK